MKNVFMLMKKYAKSTAILLLVEFAILFSSCQKPFSINATYEDFPIVYAIFNLSDSTQYIKVYKSFLTEGNVEDLTKDWHNYTYLDSIEVYVEEYDSKDTLLQIIKFDTTTEIPKDSGMFAYPEQLLYKANLSIKRDCSYKLCVLNPYTKKMVVGTAPVVDTVQLMSPRRNQVKPVMLSLPFTQDFKVSFTKAANATYYRVTMSYYYTEIMSDGTDRAAQPIVWNLGGVDGAAMLNLYSTASYKSQNLFKLIAGKVVEDDSVVKRHTDSIVIEIISQGDALTKYILATTPTSSINQEQANYTNLTAYNTDTKEEKYVLGVFSMMSKSKFHFDDFATPGTRDTLLYGQYTKDLKFTDIH